MSNTPRIVDISVRVYRMLIGIYPKSFRERFADEMTQVCRDLISNAWRDWGTAGVIRIWLRIMFDLLSTLPREHWAHRSGKLEMRTAAFAVFSIAFSAFTCLLQMVVIGFLFALWRLKVGEFPLGMPLWVEVVLVFVPSFSTGLILYRVKPFCGPAITVPLGIVLFWGTASLMEERITWWIRLGFVGIMGLTAVLGSVVSAALSRRRANPTPPTGLPLSS